MVLKRVLGAVQRLENAMKKRNVEWALLLLEKVLNLQYAVALRFFAFCSCFDTSGYDGFS
jgi:hypothetical protein